MMKWTAWLLFGLPMALGCGSVSRDNPDAAELPDDGGDGSSDAGSGSDAAGGSDASVPPVCTANQALRCEGSELVRCNSDGTAEVRESCSLGCNTTAVRCNDVAPSNGLAPHLDMAAGEPDLDLGAMATINTDDGTIQVDGRPVAVRSATITQAPAPPIRVFVVRSLATSAVKVSGVNALAIVSHGDIRVGGVFAASASGNTPGAGGFNDGSCTGAPGAPPVAGGAVGAAGGGGFGSVGGRGGSATNANGTSAGGGGGSTTGNSTLVPLRGGCDAGTVGASLFGAGGGAIQLVSRTKITVSGVLAANGSSGSGGGSGGGILLEAPAVVVSGAVVANGGAGAGGCFLPRAGDNGRLDAIPATGGTACDTNGRNGGDGAAGNTGARIGGTLSVVGTGGNIAFAGYGGGGAGRLRVNTVSGGLDAPGVFSPNPVTGTIATR